MLVVCAAMGANQSAIGSHRAEVLESESVGTKTISIFENICEATLNSIKPTFICDVTKLKSSSTSQQDRQVRLERYISIMTFF